MKSLTTFFIFCLFSLILISECCPKCKGKPNSTKIFITSTLKTIVNKTQTYDVLKVADGDTITVRNNNDKNVSRIRFMCIDAPEKSQGNWGELALKKLAELLPLHTNITLNGSTTDMYNRTISQIINNKGININKMMIEVGLAVVYPYQKGCNDFKKIEDAAKKTKAGVWSDPKFEMPWDYRKNNGIGYRGNVNNHYHTHQATTMSHSKTTKPKKI